MLNLYRRLLAYRKSHPVLQRGDYQPVDPPPTNCFVYLRHIEGLDRLLVALNFSSDDVHLNLPQYGSGNLVISTHLDRTESVDLSNLLLRGDEGVVIELI
ncbi:MAG: DUF3459 domain-containing protein [Anaerolineales bacterium]